MQLPSVIVYKVKPTTYWLVRCLANVSHVGLPNIVIGRRILPELIQDMATSANVSQAALQLMNDSAVRAQALADLKEVRMILGEPGAVLRVADIVLDVAAEKRR